MNKSKFLKRSLAAILAILMVVAMVPMGALAAEETFDVSVNSRQATTTDNGDSYNVTIYNTRLASIDWASKPEWTATVKTARNVTLNLPVSNLDLMSEAKEENGVYKLDMTFKKGTQTVNATLNITIETSVPNDDVTLQAVRANQTIGSNTYSAIDGVKKDNGNIEITVPLGMDATNVGLDSIAASDVAKIFVPSSPYATVTYSYASAAHEGTVTVKAPTGRTAKYKVTFVQEAGLTDMAVNFGAEHTGKVEFTGPTYEAGSNRSIYTAYVEDLDATKAGSAHIIFNHGKNVVRVEDPEIDSFNGTDPAWGDTGNIDEPIQSEYNTIKFAYSSGDYIAFLTAKTKANKADHDAADNHAYLGNIKLVLKDAATAPEEPEAPVIKEFQFNGYEAQYEPAGLVSPIEVYVDNSYFTEAGAGNLTGRISLTTDSAADIKLINNNSNEQKNVTRLGKPANGTKYIANINTKDIANGFTLRVSKQGNAAVYRDYKVILRRDTGYGSDIKRVYLANGKKETIVEATKAGNNQFIFNMDPTEYKAIVAKPGTWTLKPNAEYIVNYAYDATSDGADDITLPVKYTFSDKFFGSEGISSVLPADPATYYFYLDWDSTDEVFKLSAGTGSAPKVIATSEVDSTKLNQLNFVTEGDFVTETGKDIGSLTFTFAEGTGNGGGLDYTDVTAVTNYYFTDSGAGKGTFFKNGYMDDAAGTTGNPTTTGCFGASNADSTIRNTNGPVSYTAAGTKTDLKTAIKGLYLIIESDKGVVVTPGGDLSSVLTSGNRITDYRGVSPWKPQNADFSYSDTAAYEEHENYITKLSTYWDAEDAGTDETYDYLLKLSTDYKAGSYITVGQNTVGDNTGDVALIVTSSNLGANNTNGTQTWAIRFQDSTTDPGTTTYTDAAELKIKGVTTAVDEDLIYDGRSASTDKETGGTGSFDVAGPYNEDNPYIGGIDRDGHNYFKADEPVAVPNTLNEYYIKVTVPEDYFVAGQHVYLDALTISTGAEVVRGDAVTINAAALKKPDTLDWYEKNIVEYYSLDMDSQDKATNSVANREFTIAAKDLNAWYGGTFNKGSVSDDNIFYVYSDKIIGTNTVADNTYTRKYYITFVKEEFENVETMTGVTAADSSTGITGTPNAYEKWLTLNVPFSRNWTNYRDDASRDFKLNFSTNGKAILVDAAQDAYNGPFGSGNVSTTYLDKKRQVLRDIQIDEDTTFFVKDNELWIHDQYTGKDTKVTGRGLNTNFTYPAWGVITSGNAELHVFNEDQSSINTYRLSLSVNNASSAKEIVSIRVDETSAVNTSGTLWTVDLGPAGSENLAKVMLNITVSPTAKVLTVGGKDYVANGTYDLTKPVEIIVQDENGQTKTYTLSATGEEPNPPVDEKESDKYTDIPSGAMGDWVKDAINYGIMGNAGSEGEHVFDPKGNTPRMWIALMIARADIMANDGTISNITDATTKLMADYGNKAPDYKDTANIPASAKAAVAYCQEKGIMNGDNAGNFNPNGIVNRMEVASILKNWLKLPDGDKTENIHNFKDWDSIDNWAKGNINAVATDKIMEGHDDGTFGKGTLTREQTAVVMVKAFERLKGITE